MDVLKKLFKNKFPEIPENDTDALAFLKARGVSEGLIQSQVNKSLNMPYFDVSGELQTEHVKLFSKDEMKARRLFPVRIENSKVLFVVNDFTSRTLRSYAEEYCKKLGTHDYEFQFLLTPIFEDLLSSLIMGLDLSKFQTDVKPTDTSLNIHQLSEVSNANFDVDTVAEVILSKGFDNRASDIHIEPLPKGFQVRYRVDGRLSILDPYDVSEAQTSALINHFKIKSGLRIEERRKGQDGRIRDRKYKGNSYDLRISTVAGTINEKIAIRIFANNSSIPDMQGLGFTKFYTTVIQKDMEKHAGLILNTGSVGSGKSTTLRTLLHTLDAKELNIYTIEDPVERVIPYITHICVKETGVDFAVHLETLLRQDPDVIAIGEIRNLKTMEMAIEAALTGNLVFATLHTNSATEALYRIFQLGIEPYQLAAALLGISSQRLVRTLCPYCAEKRKIQEDEKNLIKGLMQRYPKFATFNPEKFEYLHDAMGCNHCNYTGFYGRIVIAEYLSITQEIKTNILTEEVGRETLIELSGNNFVPIEIDALNKVMLGKTTLSEVLEFI